MHRVKYKNKYIVNGKPVTKTELFPRIVKKTQIKFTDEEMELVNKGLNCNLGHKKKQCLCNLAIEPEAAVARLSTQEQEHVRHLIAHNL